MEPISLLLSTAQLVDSAHYYLQEAAVCADPSRGPMQMVAAMSTAFPVVLAFGELLEGKRSNHQLAIRRFCEYMPWESWLIPLNEKDKPDDPAELLCKLRNAMVHALGMPGGVSLMPTKAGRGWARERGDLFAIMPAQFVTAVGRAVQAIVEKNRDLDAARLFLAWDRFPSVMIRTPAAA